MMHPPQKAVRSSWPNMNSESLFSINTPKVVLVSAMKSWHSTLCKTRKPRLLLLNILRFLLSKLRHSVNQRVRWRPAWGYTVNPGFMELLFQSIYTVAQLSNSSSRDTSFDLCSLLHMWHIEGHTNIHKNVYNSGYKVHGNIKILKRILLGLEKWFNG